MGASNANRVSLGAAHRAGSLAMARFLEMGSSRTVEGKGDPAMLTVEQEGQRESRQTVIAV